MQTYLLTIQVRMNCFDDLNARGMAKTILETAQIDSLKNSTHKGEPTFQVNTKLQEIKENVPPRKIEL